MEGPPSTFWLSGFYNTRAFLTAVKQNHARSQHLPVDSFTFHCLVRSCSLLAALERATQIINFSLKVMADSKADGPDNGGVLVYGLYLEGAAWSEQNQCLMEPEGRTIFSKMPTVCHSKVFDL